MRVRRAVVVLRIDAEFDAGEVDREVRMLFDDKYGDEVYVEEVVEHYREDGDV